MGDSCELSGGSATSLATVLVSASPAALPPSSTQSSSGLLATASATSLAPTPLAAALSQSGITLPIPFLDLSAQVIRDLPLENVSALQRFISDAKSELGTLSAMVQSGLEMRYADAARAQLLAKGQDTGTTHIEDAGFDITVEIRLRPVALAAHDHRPRRGAREIELLRAGAE